MGLKWNISGALIVFLIIIIPFSSVKAQVTVQARMDTSMMLIGDQTNVVLEATFPDSLLVGMPIFSDTIINKLEILNISDIDTVKTDHGLKISQKYLVTCFDSGWYAIPPLNFTIGFPKSGRIDTLQSRPIYFGVQTMKIDTTHANAIADIKPPIDAPITFREILPFIGYGLGILLIIALGILIYFRFVKKEPIFVKREKPKEPAHIIAFRDLDLLKEQKLWQKGLVKEYYSQLTEVLRKYIEDRFAILAMESTTDEIMESFRLSGDLEKEIKDDLQNLLVSADFVKFAKAEPQADENEQSMNFAYRFVSKTKLVEALRDEDENVEVVDSEIDIVESDKK